MNLYLIIFTSGSYKMEQTYQNHKELFMALEKHFTLHLVNHTETESIPPKAGIYCKRRRGRFRYQKLQHTALPDYTACRRIEQFTCRRTGNSRMRTQ